ncbi:NAD(P)/FAD-dependent oxidoreductase, partial [Pandoraea nosoerga]|nr:NAD(P)/FAD-dependent oxidoreductase [Pandoraea nosoerga]
AIALGVALGRLGIPYTIVEKQDEIGGTWYVNRYPGCGVDTPNHSYSFSSGPRNPGPRFSAQPQKLLVYLLKFGRNHDTRGPAPLSTELVSSHGDEGNRRWISTLRTANGEQTFESTVLV